MSRAPAEGASTERDFSARLPDPGAGEEVTTLVEGFNAVLRSLQEWEFELSRRTWALDQVNDKLRRMAMELALREEAQKARLAVELRDGPIQKVALVQIQIESAAQRPGEESAEMLAAGVELLSETVDELRVEDDGVGFSTSQIGRETGDGYGLRGVCERLALVDGGLTLEDLRPGARVALWIPIPVENR